MAKQAELDVGNYGEAAVIQQRTEPEQEAAEGENVSEPKVWGKKDMLRKAEQINNGIEPDLLFHSSMRHLESVC